jgi:site-specific recombinase XerD
MFPDKRVNQFTEDNLVAYVLERRRDGELPVKNTVNTRMGVCRSLFGWAKHRGLVEVNPAEDLAYRCRVWGTGGRRAGQWLEPDEVRVMMAATDGPTELDARDRVILAVPMTTALRRDEVVRLRLGSLA